MRTRYLVAIIATTAPLLAQNHLDLYPGTTTASSRGSLHSSAGETLTGFHTSHWQGIGDDGSKCSIKILDAFLQDQNAATQESFHWVIRSGTDANGPTTGAAGLLHRVGPMATPANASGGIRAWLVTSSFATQLTIPCTSFFAVGALLPAAPQWVADGLSTHVAYGSAADQHPNAVDSAWEIIGNATAAGHPTFKRSWRYGIKVMNPVLQMGVGQKFGNGGMYPKIGTTLMARISAGPSFANALSIFYVDAFKGPGVALFPGTRFYLVGLVPEQITRTFLDANGDGLHVLGPVPSWSPKFTFPFQCLLINGSTFALTNMHAATADQ